MISIIIIIQIIDIRLKKKAIDDRSRKGKRRRMITFISSMINDDEIIALIFDISSFGGSEIE